MSTLEERRACDPHGGGRTLAVHGEHDADEAHGLKELPTTLQTVDLLLQRAHTHTHTHTLMRETM